MTRRLEAGAGRYNKLKNIMRQRSLFKLVCGAGNEDPKEVKNLSLIFTLAGSTMLDLSANTDIVDAANEGVQRAYEIAPYLGRQLKVRPYLNVSVGIKGDPHVRKAAIDFNKCVKCGRCILACKQKAISYNFKVKDYRCIGCGYCAAACPKAAIRFLNKRLDLKKILPLCINRGVETLELHAAVEDDAAFLKDWKVINDLIKDNFISLCIDRYLLSNKRLIERVRSAFEITGQRLIIQADGIPMSGSEKDDYNCTLQAIACADIIQKSGIPVMMILSGGTNSKTGLLARQCGIKANGIALGSFARVMLRNFTARDGFSNNIRLIKKAVSVAEKLIRVNIGAISG